ncbi:hypothetical protein Tco_0267185 [Tanacetum coccineum]
MSPTKSLFDVGSRRISIFIVSTFVSLGCSSNTTRIMRRTLKILLVITIPPALAGSWEHVPNLTILITLIKPNGDALRKCILKGTYTPTIVTTPTVPATEDSPAVPEQTTFETAMNMTPKNRAHFESEKEAIHLILTGIEMKL